MKTEISEGGVWKLGSGAKYQDRANQGCFSPRELVSTHQFGWDTLAHGFVVMDTMGFGGSLHHRLDVPVDLAEAFLLRCLDVAFAEKFLTSIYPPESVEELIGVSGAQLRVHCSKVTELRGGRYIMPGLSLSRADGTDAGRDHIFLFYEMRNDFRARIARHTAESVQTHLRG